MEDFKLNAAMAALDFIKPFQKIGLGAGTTVFHLIDLILQNDALAKTLTYVSPSFRTREYLRDLCLSSQLTSDIDGIDIYFDSCDQLDRELNALKSGGGIHSNEKIVAAIAEEFILLADHNKLVDKLNCIYPLVIEILPDASPIVFREIERNYPNAIANVRMSNQKDGAVISENGNLLIDLHLSSINELKEMNIDIKMIPGVLDHSLFYKMATKAIVAGPTGIKIIEQTATLSSVKSN